MSTFYIAGSPSDRLTAEASVGGDTGAVVNLKALVEAGAKLGFHQVLERVFPPTGRALSEALVASCGDVDATLGHAPGFGDTFSTTRGDYDNQSRAVPATAPNTPLDSRRFSAPTAGRESAGRLAKPFHHATSPPPIKRRHRDAPLSGGFDHRPGTKRPAL